MTHVDVHTHQMAHEPLFQFQGDLTPLFSAYKTIDCVGIWKKDVLGHLSFHFSEFAFIFEM